MQRVIQWLDNIIESCSGQDSVMLRIEELKELRNSLTKKTTLCEIYGTEIRFSEFVDEDLIVERAKEIWNNPDKYSDFKKGSDLSYYGFLKFLWIKYPDGTERRLADIITDQA